MDESQLKKYKVATILALKSLGKSAHDRELSYAVAEGLEGVPDDSPDFDYGGLYSDLKIARESLMWEGKIARTDRGVWVLVSRSAGRSY